MSGSINQIQIAYSAEEDRILFRVNSTDRKEFRFWLTRRFMILLIRVLGEHRKRDPDVVSQQSEQAKEAVQSFKQEQAVRGRGLQAAVYAGRERVPARL